MQLSPRAKLCSVKGPGQRNNLQLSPSTALLCRGSRTDNLHLSPSTALLCKGRGQTDSIQLSPSTALLCQRPRTDRQCTAVSEPSTVLSKTEDRQTVYSCLRAQHCFVKDRGQTDSAQLSPSTELLCQRPKTDTQSTAVSEHSTALSKAEDRQAHSLQLSPSSTALSNTEDRHRVYSCLRAQHCSVESRGETDSLQLSSSTAVLCKAEDRQTDSVQLSPSTALLCQGLRTFGNTS